MHLKQLLNNIFTVDDFWMKQQCEEFTTKSESIGYEAATIETERGHVLNESVRNNNRVIYKDFQLATDIWKKLQPFAPQRIGNSIAVGLNETV